MGNVNRDGIWIVAGIRPSECKGGEAKKCLSEESHVILGSSKIGQLWVC